MNTTDEMGARGEAAPLDDPMLAMDVTDTLRHAPEIVDAPDSTEQLRRLYAQLGLEVSQSVLAEGLNAARDRRFVYEPPKRGFAVSLAQLYIYRRHWLPGAVAVALMFIIGFGGYFFVYRPYRDAQIEQARVELGKTIPAQIDALYQTIFEETKVQAAANQAEQLRAAGKAAAEKGDRAGAEAAIADLTAIRDTLRDAYRLSIVDKPNSKWGFWTFPQNNSEETNYYLVVEARDADGNALTLPIRSEQGRTDSVNVWAIRVPEEVYRAVEADKGDDGVIQHNLVGIKEFGFLQPDYLVTVMGGALTRW